MSLSFPNSKTFFDDQLFESDCFTNIVHKTNLSTFFLRLPSFKVSFCIINFLLL